MNNNFQIKASDHNPFNIPFVLGEFVNKLVDKLDSSPTKQFTDNEIMFYVEEIILQLCNNTEQEMVKRRAMECLIAYFMVSEN